MFDRVFRSFGALTLMSLLAACAVGPDFTAPAAPHADAYVGQNAAAQNEPPPAPDLAFWRDLGDPQLTQLVDAALAANHDIRIALSRFDEANALLGASNFDRYPTLSASGDAQTGRSSASQLPGVSRSQRDGELFDTRLSAIWELDFFGRVRRSIESQRAETEASASDLAAVQVGIVAELADAYFQMRGVQAQLTVARNNASNQGDTLRLIDALLQNGRGTAFDSDRTQAQLALTQARIPPLEAQAAVLANRIAVLTGQTPESLAVQLAQSAPQIALPASVNAGVPGDLLRRRPDIAAAEQRLHGATARIGVATADLFPRFTLGGLIGSQALSVGALFGRDSEMRALTLGIDGSFLDVGRVRARIAGANAQAAGAMASYERTVLRAMEETENALVRLARSHEEREALTRAAQSSERAVNVARVQFDAGAIGVLDVLSAERTRLDAEDQLVQSRAREATSLIALYKSLAGGWPQQLPAMASADAVTAANAPKVSVD
ncbi:efflux transporter outer membrane subunit [Alcaligenaceae bacterium B3P038]|nr:efflux transporter outer membrane subunit [Alcaligenaceae bacterium B3P038]